MFTVWGVGFVPLAGYAIATDVWQLALMAAVFFACSTAGMVVWNTLMHTLVEDEMLGRVSGLDWFVSLGLAPVSLALTGPVSGLIGIDATLIGASGLGLLAFGLLFLPGVRDPERSLNSAEA